MRDVLHMRFRALLTEHQADQVVTLLQAFTKLRAALDHEERCVSRWTLRVVNEGRGSEAESEALATVRRAGELREAAAAAVKDCGMHLDQALSGAGTARRQA